MNRIKVLSALAALTVAGAFASASTPALAYTNFQVNFKVVNADPTNSMIRQTVPLPSGVSNLIVPAASIPAGGSDPASGYATFSLSYPAIGSASQISLVYAKSDGTSACTYTISVKRNAPASFTLHFTSSDSTRCPIPSDATNLDGQFTSTTYVLNWSS